MTAKNILFFLHLQQNNHNNVAGIIQQHIEEQNEI